MSKENTEKTDDAVKIEIEEEKAEDAADIPQDAEAEKAESAGEAPEAEEKAEGGQEKSAEKPAEPQQSESEKYARLFAEFQNYKRRTEKEKSDLYAYAGEKFATDLLAVIDNFERAMDAKPEGDKFADGMEMILTQLRGVMTKNHVEEIKALGEPFDPNFHNAVMTEAAEDKESGIVTKVFQKGYTLNSKVIRPAMVAVSQ